jgi:hypothetical protein
MITRSVWNWNALEYATPCRQVAMGTDFGGELASLHVSTACAVPLALST